MRRIRLALLLFVLLAVAACGDSESDGDTEGSTGAGPPCFGLTEVDALPEWTSGTGAVDFLEEENRAGCAVRRPGVVVVTADGVPDDTSGRRLVAAYLDDCRAFVGQDSLPGELLIPPDAIQTWVCQQPSEGGFAVVQLEGT